jgi:hypothetical protein
LARRVFFSSLKLFVEVHSTGSHILLPQPRELRVAGYIWFVIGQSKEVLELKITLIEVRLSSDLSAASVLRLQKTMQPNSFKLQDVVPKFI